MRVKRLGKIIVAFQECKLAGNKICEYLLTHAEKAMAPHSRTLAWRIPWTEEPGGLQSMGSRRVRHDWVTSLSLLTFMHWRKQWQPTPVFLPGESQGQRSLVGCSLWSRIESDTIKGDLEAAAWPMDIRNTSRNWRRRQKQEERDRGRNKVKGQVTINPRRIRRNRIE